jgi:DNA replication protein DnaC
MSVGTALMAVMAAALIDRLVHHCHLVTIRGNSYRLRQHTEL